jgi:hypothetical protein
MESYAGQILPCGIVFYIREINRYAIFIQQVFSSGPCSSGLRGGSKTMDAATGEYQASVFCNCRYHPGCDSQYPAVPTTMKKGGLSLLSIMFAS